MENDDLEEKYLSLLCCSDIQSTYLGLTLLCEEEEEVQFAILCHIADKIIESDSRSPFFGFSRDYGLFFKWGYSIIPITDLNSLAESYKNNNALLKVHFRNTELTGKYLPILTISFEVSLTSKEKIKFSSAMIRSQDEYSFISDKTYKSLKAALKAFIYGE